MKLSSLHAAVCVALFSVNARAQAAPPTNETAAEAQFNEGRKLMEAGRATEACPKFESSQRLDPALGTLLNLADCYEKIGLLASAQQRFLEAAQTAARDGFPDAVQGARDRAAALEPRLAKLSIRAEQPAPGLAVACDGRPIDPAQWSVGVPVDPGTHTIVAGAPARSNFQTTVVIDSRPGLRIVKIPELANEPGSAAAPSPASTETAPSSSSGGLGTKRTLALVAGGVGVVGVAVGAIFGLRSISKKNEAEEHCDGNACRDQVGVDLKSDAIQAGNISTIAFVVGGVGLAAGTTLWLLGGSDEAASSVGLRFTPGGAHLAGRF
ncbi:MAG: tetratricopeptide repeat protein [Myxococcota bacterium]